METMSLCTAAANRSTDYSELGRELIAARCGTHSLGLIYEFLLKVCHDTSQAEADFVAFISGEFPPRLLKEARSWIAAEQKRDAKRPLINPDSSAPAADRLVAA